MRIYLAAPYFNVEQVNLNEELIAALEAAGHVVFAEQRDEFATRGPNVAEQTSRRSDDRLADSDAVVAVVEYRGCSMFGVPDEVAPRPRHEWVRDVRQARAALDDALRTLEAGETSVRTLAGQVKRAMSHLCTRPWYTDPIVLWEIGCARPRRIPVVGFSAAANLPLLLPYLMECVVHTIPKVVTAANLLAYAISKAGPVSDDDEYSRVMNEVRRLGKPDGDHVEATANS